jgi:hypothetical protein
MLACLACSVGAAEGAVAVQAPSNDMRHVRAAQTSLSLAWHGIVAGTSCWPLWQAV